MIVLVLISFSLVGSDCNEIIKNVGNTSCSGSQVNVIGTWRFVYNAGGIRDVCLGETVQFATSGIAYLTCPGQQTIQRNYTVSNDYILTYTETGVKYCLSGDTTELQLTGQNINRTIVYDKVITGDNFKNGSPNDGFIRSNNSSEIVRTNY